MVPQRYRLQLRNQPDFFTQAHKWFSPLFTVFFKVAAEPQVATIVPLKATATHVEKNRTKRRVDAIWQQLLKDGVVAGHLALVVKRKGVEASSKELQQELRRLLTKNRSS